MAVGGHPPSIHIPARDRNEIYQFTLDGVRRGSFGARPGWCRLPPGRAVRWRSGRRCVRGNWKGEAGPGPPEREGSGGPPPDTHPPFLDVTVDTEGYLWVRKWSDSETGLPDQWSVFSPEGRWLGVMAVPVGAGCDGRCRSLRGLHFFLLVDRDFFVICGRTNSRSRESRGTGFGGSGSGGGRFTTTGI